jgi:signal transduction histidine kinase
VRVRVHGNETSVRIEVSNGGEAIDPSVAEGLFDPLRRGDRDESPFQ